MEEASFIASTIEGAGIVTYPHFWDERGTFDRLLNNSLLSSMNVEHIVDCYISRSKKNVLRGMHIMATEAQEYKFVTCTGGAAIDVIVDLRKGSSTYLKTASYELNGDELKTVCIPPGVAHGFVTLQDRTELLYHSTARYKKENDLGVLWSSIDFDWGFDEDCKDLIISERDKRLPKSREFNYDAR